MLFGHIRRIAQQRFHLSFVLLGHKAVVYDFNFQLVVFRINTEQNLPRPACQAVFHRIFHNRLDDQPGNLNAHQRLIYPLLILEFLAEALSDDIAVSLHIADFLRKRYHLLLLPVHGGLHHGGKGLNHAAHPFIPFHSGLPVDDFQRIVQEMGIDLGLQRHDIGIPQRQLLQINLFKLVLQLIGHAVEGIIQIKELPASLLFFDLYAEMPLFDFRRRIYQALHRYRNIPVQEIKYNKNKRYGKGHHQDSNIPERHFFIMDGVIIKLRHIPDDMIIHFPLTDYICVATPFMIQAASSCAFPGGVILRPVPSPDPLSIYAHIVIHKPGNSLNALEYAVFVNIHNNNRVRFIGGRHDIPDHIQMILLRRTAYTSIYFLRYLSNDITCLILKLLDAAIIITPVGKIHILRLINKINDCT